MMELIAQNMAPIMFASLVVFLLLGYPVAFALAANGLLGADRREMLAAIPSDDLATVLRRAAALSAITVSRAGANPPWSHELT